MTSSLEPLAARLADALSVPLPPPARARVVRWLEEAQRWNAKLDLTAARTDEALVEVLLADALVASDERLTPRGARLVDVGTGAGTPGLGLALLRDDVTALLVEPLHKRVAFLRTVVGALDLAARVTVREARLDEARPEALGHFDLAVSRATLPPERWAAAALRLAPAALVFLVDAAPTLPEGAHVAREVRYALPGSGAPRRLVRVER